MFNPSDPASDSPVDVEKRSDVPKADSPKIKEIIDNQPEQPPSPEPADAQLSGRCEITHKDTISALSRATTNVCKNRIEEVYCSHKDQLLLPKAIERTCSHETTYIANGADIVEKDYIPKVSVRIAYFLIVHGRSVRQIRRLFKMIYHVDHFFYFHVDVRKSITKSTLGCN